MRSYATLAKFLKSLFIFLLVYLQLSNKLWQILFVISNHIWPNIGKIIKLSDHTLYSKDAFKIVCFLLQTRKFVKMILEYLRPKPN